LIIDNDNYENVLLVKRVEKLELKRDKNLNSNKLIWINQDSKVIVDKLCIVSFFFIGKRYFNNVVGDMVSMDTFHLLLVRS